MLTHLLGLLLQVMYRGFALTTALSLLPRRGAVAITALFFLGEHAFGGALSPGSALALLLGSWVLCWGYISTHNILVPILCHAAWNAYVWWFAMSLIPRLRQVSQSARRKYDLG
jgi:membrane protease YdiL (CAAX protease family)